MGISISLRLLVSIFQAIKLYAQSMLYFTRLRAFLYPVWSATRWCRKTPETEVFPIKCCEPVESIQNWTGTLLLRLLCDWMFCYWKHHFNSVFLYLNCYILVAVFVMLTEIINWNWNWKILKLKLILKNLITVNWNCNFNWKIWIHTTLTETVTEKSQLK